MNRTLTPEKPILLVDDEPAFLQSLSMTLKVEAGLNNLKLCHDSREVEGLLEQHEFSLIILDQMMPHISGKELLEKIANRYPEVPMIMLTGMNQLQQAIDCMKVGAFDYFIKTGETQRLLAGIFHALKQQQLQEECRRLASSLVERQLKQPHIFNGIITNSAQMHRIFRYLEAISCSQEPVLITGDSGVGKELIARVIHQLCRPDSPWAAINVAGLDDAMFSDAMFGHAKGAFTGADRIRPGMVETAGAGTLFLDEIGDLSTESQVKLLRLLQEREYFAIGSDKVKYSHARIVVATSKNLEQLQSENGFRKDLFYRLRSHHVHIPALKERPEDIPLLLDHFLQQAADEMGKKKPTPPPELSDWLTLHDFPGNVRELRAMVYDAVSIHNSKKLSMETFKQSMQLPAKKTSVTPDSHQGVIFPQVLPTLKEVSDLLVLEAMDRTNGNQSMAASLLGISQPSLSLRMKKIKTGQKKPI